MPDLINKTDMCRRTNTTCSHVIAATHASNRLSDVIAQTIGWERDYVTAAGDGWNPGRTPRGKTRDRLLLLYSIQNRVRTRLDKWNDGFGSFMIDLQVEL